MLGDAYLLAGVRALLGPARAAVLPATLHIGWLDSDGDLIAMSGRTVSAAAFTAVGSVMVNSAALDAGEAEAGWTIAAVGLFDAATGGSLVLSADLALPMAPTAGAALSIAPGALRFQVTA